MKDKTGKYAYIWLTSTPRAVENVIGQLVKISDIEKDRAKIVGI